MKVNINSGKFLLLFFLLFRSGVVSGQDFINESFDGETFPPVGWTQEQVSGTGLWNRTTSGIHPTCSPRSGSGMAMDSSYYFAVNTSAVLCSPNLDFTGSSDIKVQFWMYRDNLQLTKLDVVDVYINTTNSLSGALLLGTVNRPITAEPVVASTGWYQYEYSIPGSYNGADNYILFKATSKYGNNMFVDDVRVYIPQPADNPPISFSTADIGQNGMTVKWVDNSTNEEGFRVYTSTDNVNFTQYGSDIPTTTSAGTGTEYSQVLTSLLPGTTYYFRISAYLDAESDYLTGSEATLPPDQIISQASGNWNDPATWDTGTVPTSVDNVVISSGHTVTVNTAGNFNGITIDGTLTFDPYTLTGVNVTVSATGIININSGTTAILSLSGNITNNGSIDFYQSDVILGRLTFTGSSTQTFDADGTTDIGTITVNKGTSKSNVIELLANGTFTIRGGATANFLTLTNGTLKISGSATVSSNVFQSGGYTIPSTAGIWLNNSNFTVLGQGAPVVNNGLIRITAGAYNVGTDSDNDLIAGSGAVFTIEGGTLNLASRFASNNPVSFTLSGGDINVNTVDNTSTTASFGLTSTSNTITISGGNINLIKPSVATTPLDYNLVGSSISISGGSLNVGVGTTPSPYVFRVQGIIPNLVIDNTTNSKSVLLSAATSIYGNTTLNTGTTLNVQTSNLLVYGNTNQPGNILNNGLITNSSAAGSNRLSFVGAHGLQTLSGTGTLGDATTPFAGIVFSNAAGVDLESSIVTNWINLLNGAVTGSNNITLGNGGTSSPIVKVGGSPSLNAGSFDQAPVFNAGTTYGVNYSTSLSAYNTGFELPATLSGNFELTSNVDVTLSSSTSVSKLVFGSSNTGDLITSDINLLTVSSTLPEDVILNTGNVGVVKGPLARILPSSLVSGSTYVFPVGKGSANYLELVNPTTTVDGTVTVKVNVFDEASGGTAGTNIQNGSLESRYWVAEILSGEANFINAQVRLSQSTPLLTAESGIGKSLSKTGVYDLVSSDHPVDNKIITDVVSDFGYFAIGVKEVSQVYESSITTQTNTDIIMQGADDQLIIGIEISAIGNSPALQVTNLDFSTNGTSDYSDIAYAKLYYTGTSSTFATTTQVGSTVVNPEVNFSINPSQDLAEGTNYFWLVYGINESATDKNIVDAECSSITVGGIPYAPTVTTPAGSRTIRGFLSGTYLVGIGGDYSTITEAIYDLNSIGVSSSVTFSLTDETYAGDETFPITVNEIINSSELNLVIIKPTIGVTPEISGNADPLFIVNASNFVIDGSNVIDGSTRDLTIINSGTGTSSGVIYTGNGVSNVSYKNIIGVGGLTTAGYGIILDGVTNSKVVNSKFYKSNIGIQVKGNSSQILIESNEIGSSVSGDKIHTTGIEVQNTNNFTIRNNIVVGLSSASTATSTAILVSGTSSSGDIYSNEIRNIKNTRTLGYGSNGLRLNSSSTSSQINIYNNVISDIASAGYNGWDFDDNGYGIVIASGGGYGLYYNTIHLNTDQTGTTGGNTAGINILSAITTANSIDIRNNIIISTQTKGNRYAVYCAANSNVFSNIDFNNYHAPTGVGFIGGLVRTTLADWQTGTGKDANSLNEMAYFTSLTDLSLISNKNCALDGFATPLALVTTDYNGSARNELNPDMGAIEFTTTPLDPPSTQDEDACFGALIPDLSATTSGTAKWYSDEELINLVYTGSPYNTGQTEVGSYTYYVTDNHGSCISEASVVTLTINPLPVVTAPDDFAVCNGEPTTLTATGNANTYEWNNDVVNGVEFTPIETKTYTVTGTITETGCQATDDVVVTVKPIPAPTISTVHQIDYCQGDIISTTFTIDIVGDSYQWLLDDLTIEGATSNEYIATQKGTYSVEVTVDGCTGVSNEQTITVNPEANISTTDAIVYCEGDIISTTFEVDIIAESYQWLKNGAVIDGATSSTFTAEEVGIYSVELTVDGCTGISNEIAISTNPLPVAEISTPDDLIYCEGDAISVTFTATPADAAYRWFKNDVLIDSETSSTLTATTAGSYTAEVTVNGCSDISDPLEIVVNPLPVAEISTPDYLIYCEGDAVSVTFTATPADATYRWFRDGIHLDGETLSTLTATTAGSYTAEVTVNGCSDISDPLEIVVNPLPVAEISTLDDLIYCEGDALSLTFTATPADASYRWFKNDVLVDGETSSTLTATTAGSYTAEVTVNGCSDISDPLEIVVNPLPVAEISTPHNLIYCEGDAISVAFNAEPSNGTYEWFEDGILIEGETSQNYTATKAGIYSAKVTINGCFDLSESIEIVTNPLPEPTIQTLENLVYCQGDIINVNFTVDIADGIYQWLLNGDPIEGADQSTYTANAEGIYAVEVTVNGCNGLSNEIEIAVSPLPVPTISTTDPITYCEGEQISVDFSVDIANASYQWLLNDDQIDGADQSTYTANAEGIYAVEVTINGCNGLSNEIEIAVSPLPVPTISTTDPITYCEGEQISVDFSVDIADATYQWLLNDDPIEGADQSTYTATLPGIYSVEVTLDGCTGLSNEIEIAVSPLPVPTISTTDPITYCEGEQISVDFSVDIADATYQWLLNDDQIDGADQSTFKATASGTYSVEVTVGGCTGISNEIEIAILPLPIPIISTIEPIAYCEGDQISTEFTVNITDAIYQWLLNGDPIVGADQSTYTAISAGIYSVEVTVAGCLGGSNEVEIISVPLPVTSLPTDTVFLPNFESYLFDAGPGFASYLWFDESNGQTYFFDGEVWGTGIYDIWVEVTNEYGCLTRDSTVVSVGLVGIEQVEPWLFNLFPNPSRGNINIIITGLTAKKIKMDIYSITGQRIYRKEYGLNGPDFNTTIILNDIPKGVYILSINDGKFLVNKRFVVE